MANDGQNNAPTGGNAGRLPFVARYWHNPDLRACPLLRRYWGDKRTSIPPNLTASIYEYAP